MSGHWRQHSEDLTLRLAHLVRLDSRPDVGDLDASLHARRAVMGLATDVLFDISGLHRHTPRRWDNHELYSHPVEHLTRILQSRAQPPPETSLAECLADEPTGLTGHVWRRAAADAVLAHHEWGRLDALDRRLGTEAWTAVHEVAQFTHALSWLDPGIAEACRAAGRVADAVVISGGVSRLRAAATAVTTLASSGPLPVLRQRRAPMARAALVVRRPEHLPAALERLTHLLRTADHVSPKHVQAAYRLLGRLSQDACVVLSTTDSVTLPVTATSGTATADKETALATLEEASVGFSLALQRAGRDPGRANSLESSDEVVVAQLQLIATLTAAERSVAGLAWVRGTPGRARQAALHLLKGAAEGGDALSEVTVRCVEERRWLVPAGINGAAALTWVPSWPHQANEINPDAPPLLKAAAEVRRLGTVVGEALSTLASEPLKAGAAASRPEVRTRLASALASAERQALPQWPRPEGVQVRPGR